MYLSYTPQQNNDGYYLRLKEGDSKATLICHCKFNLGGKALLFQTDKNRDMEKIRKYYWGRTLASFFLVLFTMPLGHAMMMIMDKTMESTAVHYAGFAMGFVGLVIVITGVFIKSDTRQTLCGLFGGLLFWTGWVEFLFQYYANRYGTQPEIVNGVVVTRPEYGAV